VQDLLKVNSQQIFDSIMKEGGHFYVCGDVGMASDVTTTLSKIIQEHGKMTSEQAQSYLLKLKVRYEIIFKSCFLQRRPEF
jgi:sulfite reductase alpha subunit-like flavoprotein